ncbi:hypothetical protein G3I59_14230 [Amycolatopsis rubida]|uniref:Secreted protein n=1 Tax=Amycolatopsis rubida TaxID=112413 RepID=A0ABX0BP42_9PSEU|nr:MULTISPECIES: hypothetical protein [Amycolatopsis]MYW91724.1 hypothetical protein [Amycolatopsis rubida]NEC56708.1 hypothetical protein [Amycolatopsis rubida]OAP20395.1 hypothetical protein A4R44_08819 [Amycolatopsis sp. M39]
MATWKSAVSCAVAACAAAAAVMVPGTAQAREVSVTVPMTGHRIVDTRLDQAGAARAVLDNGQVVRISREAYRRWNTEAKSAPGSQAAPRQTLPGNCGSATITFVEIGGKQGRMATSWTVDEPTLGFDWMVDFTDDFGVSHQTWGEVFHGASSWAADYTFTGGGGPTRAQVRSPESAVTLISLIVCVSAGPSESAIIV